MGSTVRISEVASFSAEHPRFPARNLASGKGRWTGPAEQPKPTELEAEFCLSCPTLITGLDVGNYWSASLEVQVGRSDSGGRREVLLPENHFMNRLDCFSGDNKEKMLFLKPENFQTDIASQRWDRVKVVCRQPFKFNHDAFGLSVLTIKGCGEELKDGKENTLAVAGGGGGLAEFKKKVQNVGSPAVKPARMTNTLQSLENSMRLNEEAREGGAQLQKSAMSRSAKLVARALGPDTATRDNGLVREEILAAQERDPRREECVKFLQGCNFDKLTFAEIEEVTFRTVKERWQQRMKTVMTKEQKEILKPLSIKYLNKLVSKTQKRSREDGGSADGAKRRKVSQAVLDMRRGDELDVVEVEEGGGGRNRVVARDKRDDSKGGRSIFKTKPINIDTSPERSGSKVTSWLAKKSSPARKKPAETAQFDLDLSGVEISEDSPRSRESTSSKTTSSGSLPDPEVKKSRTLSPKPIKISSQKASKISSQEASNTSTVKATKISPPKAFKLGSPKPVKTVGGKPPVYRRNRLLAFSQMSLIKAGVLVQVYDYKKSKDLPLKGGKVLTTTRGVPVTFYKVGPDIHLESEGRFHLPDIQPEHLERVFKNFTAARVSERHFPPGLEDFLTGKAGLKDTSSQGLKDSSSPPQSTEKSEANGQMASFACWLAQLKAKGPREADFTRALIREKLADQDQEIATTSCKVTLVCPLGKTRMVTPIRASTCDHIQCFDAQHYLAMNERKQKWVCPVCNKPALMENLQIDGFFTELLSSSRLPADEHEIVLQSDGTWDPLPAKKKSSPTRAPSPALSCPLCSLPFPLEELEEHAASCTGPQQQDSSVDCPICGLGMEASVLEQHAATCAAAMFGS